MIHGDLPNTSLLLTILNKQWWDSNPQVPIRLDRYLWESRRMKWEKHYMQLHGEDVVTQTKIIVVEILTDNKSPFLKSPS